MVKIKKTLPEKPFYLGKSEEVNTKWANNFVAHIDVIGKRYGVPDELIAKVKANNAVLQSISAYETMLSNWLGQWRDAKNSLMYLAASPSPILLPTQPESFPYLPTAVMANIFGPFIQAASIILANPDLTEADKKTLGLVKAEGKPVPPEQKKREKVEQYNYPAIKADVINGGVVLTITRGEKFKGKAVLLQVDREGMGNFITLGSTTARLLQENINLPSGVVTASWTYRGIYVEGQKQLSDWSPNLFVGVTNEQPIPSQAASPIGKLDFDDSSAEQVGEQPAVS